MTTIPDPRDVPFEWQPSSWEQKNGIKVDPAYCRASVYESRGRPHQCLRKARVGKRWCATHDPVEARKRREQTEARDRAASARFAAEWADRLSWKRDVEPHLCERCRARIGLVVDARREEA